MGETDDEVVQTLADLRAVGTDIVTIGQYLRPTTHHLPVARWVTARAVRRPGRRPGRRLGIPHVEAEPADPLLLPRPPGGGGGRHDTPARPAIDTAG